MKNLYRQGKLRKLDHEQNNIKEIEIKYKMTQQSEETKTTIQFKGPPISQTKTAVEIEIILC